MELKMKLGEIKHFLKKRRDERFKREYKAKLIESSYCLGSTDKLEREHVHGY